MDVSVIIVSYDARTQLKECLVSVREKTKDIDHEVIVVDNGSSDGSPEMVREEFPGVILVCNRENKGFGRANNQAAGLAKGKYYFFLNPDTLLLNNAARVFFEFFENTGDGGVGAIGSLLMDEGRKVCHSYGRFPSKMDISIGKFQYFVFKLLGGRVSWNARAWTGNDETLPLEVDYITGADLFMPADIFRQLGGFDPKFFLYFEETDLQKRMHDAGLKRLIISGPEIIHKGSGSFDKGNRSKQLRFYFKSLLQYSRKHPDSR